jgi:NDP-sugar pyrophosphorylase family protein
MTRAIIQAGGKGLRLLPYTTVLPKPLMPVADRPILEILIRQLVAQDIVDVTVTLGHLGQLIRAVIGDGSALGARVDYVEEPEPRGTIGPLRMIDGLDEPFLVMNGDLLTDFDFRQFFGEHLNSRAQLSIGAYLKPVEVSLGVLNADVDGRVTAFTEKPMYVYPCSMGIYALDPELIQFIPEGRYWGFDDLMRQCLADNVPVRAHPHDGIWLDIGRHEDYQRATEMFIEHRERLLPSKAPLEISRSAA